MPRLLLPLVLALLAVAPAAASAQGFRSANVSVIGKLPDAAGAIGARFSPDGRTMYVTGATGLGIYDVSAPARLPVARATGFLASPRWGFACQLPISPGVGRGRTLGG